MSKFAFTQLSIKGALKNKNKTGEIEDFYEIPVFTFSIILVFSLNIIDVALFYRKLFIYLTIKLDIRLLRRLYISLL